MSDYQAIYDAVRSHISGCDIGSVVRDVLSSAFDVSWMKSRLEQEATCAIQEYARPSVIYRAQVMRVSRRMDTRPTWRAYHSCRFLTAKGGDVLRAWEEGVWADGETPEAAMYAFDKKWREQR